MLFGPRLSSRTLSLLDWECANITAYLGAFGADHGLGRRAVLDDSGEFIRVLGMPLPPGYDPSSCDLVLIVNDFPARPPIGLYLLNSDRSQVQRIVQLFGRGHVMRNQGQYGAPSIPGYTWVCFHYDLNRWHYCASAPASGDNLQKFLASFYAQLAAGRG
jgi:hypothetical protein